MKLKFANYFRSNATTYSEYVKKLNESTAMAAWEDAVALFRNGIKKIKSNDVEGWVDLHKANEALKIVVGTHESEPIQQSYAKLSESIVKYSVEKKSVAEILTEGIAFGKVLKENEVIATEPVLEEVIENEALDDDAITEEPVKGAAAIMDTPVPTDKPKSSYERGFCEARKMHKAGENPKNISQQMAESTLSKEPYSEVKRWMEGFQAGWAMEEEVKKDTHEITEVVKENDDEGHEQVEADAMNDAIEEANVEFGKENPNENRLNELGKLLVGAGYKPAQDMLERIKKYLSH
jgi:hypothetical protein